MGATLWALVLIAGSMTMPADAASQAPSVSPRVSAACTTSSSPVATTLASRPPGEATATPAPTVGASPPRDPSAVSGTRPRLGGRYVRIADSPFAPKAGVGVWTGQVAVISDALTGRTLAYDPARDRWERLARSPARIDLAWPVWTGDRMIVVGDLADDGGIETWAYTPATDSWNELTDGPLRGHLSSLAWQAGSLAARISPLPDDVGIIDADTFAILDEAGRCWRAIESPASMDAALLGVSGHIVGIAPRQAQILDPLTGTWSTPIATPVDIREPGLLVGDRVLFLPLASNEEGTGGWSFDPATLTWTAVAADCPVWTGYATAAGSLAVNDTFAFDTDTGTCYRLPRSPVRHRRDPLRLWLDDRLLVWSGNGGEESPEKRSGYVYLPPTANGIR